MNGTAKHLTSSQIILLAADALHAGGKPEFTDDDLCVAAYQLDPQRFGMKGYDHPDSNRVLCEIMGHKKSSPIPLGHLIRARPKVYAITPLGRAEAARLRLDKTPLPVKPPTPGEVARRTLAELLAECDEKFRTIHTTNGDRASIDVLRSRIAAVIPTH